MWQRRGSHSYPIFWDKKKPKKKTKTKEKWKNRGKNRGKNKKERKKDEVSQFPSIWFPFCSKHKSGVRSMKPFPRCRFPQTKHSLTNNPFHLQNNHVLIASQPDLFAGFYNYYWLSFIPLVVRSMIQPIMISFTKYMIKELRFFLIFPLTAFICFKDCTYCGDKTASYNNQNVFRELQWELRDSRDFSCEAEWWFFLVW